MDHLSGPGPHREELETAVVRFAGDSGDGVQLTGAQFTLATALAGNDLETFPDFPAEIRAPVGTTFGVSAFQINFGARRIYTVGDRADVLVALNPAALKVNLRELKPGGIVILDSGQLRRAQPAQGRAWPRIRARTARSTACGWSRSTSRPTRRRRRATPACPRATSCAARTSTPWAWSTGCSSATGHPPSAGSSAASRTGRSSPPPTSRPSTPAMRSARPRSCTSSRASTSSARRPSPASTAP